MLIFDQTGMDDRVKSSNDFEDFELVLSFERDMNTLGGENCFFHVYSRGREMELLWLG